MPTVYPVGVSDWRGGDDFNDDWVPQQGGDIVRAVGDDPVDGPPEAPRRPASRFALPGDPGASRAATPPGRSQRDQSAELPHWTDPPTGQVPRVLGGDTADDDFETWTSVTGSGPRFRTDSSDWSGGDWSAGELAKDSTVGVGALDDRHDPFEGDFAPPRRGRRGRKGREGRGGRGAEPAHDQMNDPAHDPMYDQMHDPAHGHFDERAAQHGSLEGGYQAEQYPSHDAEQEGRPSDTGTRVLTALIVAVVALGAFAGGRGTTMVLATVIVGLSALELYTAFQRGGYHPATAIGLLGCVAIVPVAYNESERAFPMVTILVVAFTFLWYLVEVVRARPVINIGLTLLPFLWVGFFGAFAGAMLFFGNGGLGLLQGVIICAVGFDVMSYFAGRAFGRTALLARVSPNKTVEGFIGGAIAAVVLGAMVGKLLHPWADKGIGAGIVLGILVAIAAPLGDLCESLIKRDLGVKDLGTFLPGHGGFLDRFDAILFALPLAYYWAVHLFHV